MFALHSYGTMGSHQKWCELREIECFCVAVHTISDVIRITEMKYPPYYHITFSNSSITKSAISCKYSFEKSNLIPATA